MFRVEIFLPMYDACGVHFSKNLYATTRDELVARFGGMTAHSMTPITGLWEDTDGNVVRDEIVVYEVMAQKLEISWWRDYRSVLEQRFTQSKLLMRSTKIFVF